jgi:hypothetical protein
MKRDACRSFVGLSLQLSGCVEDPETFMVELRAWCLDKLDPDFESDIVIELEESTPPKTATEQ